MRLFSLFFVLAFTHSAHAGIGDVLFAMYPEKGVCTLSTGEQIPYPFHVYQARQLSLVGTVDPEKAKNLVPSGYEPVTFEIKGVTRRKGIALIQAIEYEQTNTLPYREVILALLVRKTKAGKSENQKLSLESFTRSFQEYGILYPFKLYLDQGLPTRAGWELGGFNKELSTVDYAFEQSQKTVSVKALSGKPLLSLKANVNADPTTLPLISDFLAVTSMGTLGRTVMVGHVSVSTFKSTDEVALSDQDPWTVRMLEMDFSPLLWEQDPAFKMVVMQADGVPIPSICKPY